MQESSVERWEKLCPTAVSQWPKLVVQRSAQRRAVVGRGRGRQGSGRGALECCMGVRLTALRCRGVRGGGCVTPGLQGCVCRAGGWATLHLQPQWPPKSAHLPLLRNLGSHFGVR